MPKPVIMRLKPAQQDHVLFIKKLYQDNIQDLQVWLQEALNHCVWGQLGELPSQIRGRKHDRSLFSACLTLISDVMS